MGEALGKTIIFFSIVIFLGGFLPALGITVYENIFIVDVSKDITKKIIWGCFILVFLLAFYIDQRNDKRS